MLKFADCIHILTLFSFWTVIIWSKAVSGTEVQRPRGVPLSKASFYNPSNDFTCLDGSATIPFKYVNDDYCDCQDGSDEPGTSACPNGSFYCKNLGHLASVLPSSRVNDGICDCCDGSDEYQSGTCGNTCKEMGAAAREEAVKRYELENQGYQAKLEYINQGKTAKVAHQEKLVALKAEQVEAEALKAEKEANKKEIEQAERQALDKYRQVEQDSLLKKEETQRQKREAEGLQAFDVLDANKDGKLQMAEIQVHKIFDQNKDGIVSDDEARFFLHMENEMDKNEFLTTGWMLLKPYFMMDPGLLQHHSEEAASHDEEDILPEGEDEHRDEEPTEEEEPHEGEEEYVKPSPVTGAAPEYDPETQALVESANKARDAFDEADRRLRDIEREIRQLEESSHKDYGPDEEFQALDGQCFEYTDREYTYKLCPFDHASQRSKHGGSETRLGSWDSWDGPSDDKYARQRYDRGVQCWNGPSRSAKVVLSCGMENKVTSVTEPNRCEYEVQFTTPAICKEPKKPTEENDLHDEL